MPLVGDIIMGCREQMTDLPQSLLPPVVASISEESFTTSPPLIFLAGQIFRYQVTQLNPWGESAPTTIATHTVVQPACSIVVGGACSYSATAIRIYFSVINGAALDQYFQISLNNQGTFVATITGA